METEELVRKAGTGDAGAFTELTRRYQNLAFGYAFSLLRDFHLAQDAAQESFLAAYQGLPALREPEAFPGWLRGIVRYQCGRLRRRCRVETVPLEQAAELSGSGQSPADQVERAETAAAIAAAVAALPLPKREVVVLFYLQELSHGETARFLGVPVTTVNNRLHAARGKLRRRMLAMLGNAVQENGLPEDFAANVGRIVEVRGPVVEARFAPGDLPALLTPLVLTDEPGEVEIPVEVAQRLEDGLVRCIATASPRGLRSGTRVVRTPMQSRAGVAPEALESALRQLGPVRDGDPTLIETGIKVIDLFSPLPKRGRVGLLGPAGTGKVVLLQELIHRLGKSAEGLSIFYMVRRNDAEFFQDMVNKEPLFLEQSAGTVGGIETYYLLTDRAVDPEFPAATQSLDATLFCSPLVAAYGIWPAQDPFLSLSRLLTPALVGEEHCRVAERAREAIQHSRMLTRDPQVVELVALGAFRKAVECAQQSPQQALNRLGAEDHLLVSRARKLERFLSQPFYVAEPFTGRPGNWVSREETVRACRGILDGEYDSLDEAAFLLVGGIEETVARSRG